MAHQGPKPRIEPCPKRIRVLFHGKYIVDTLNAKLVWEHAYYPSYYFPVSDLSPTYLRETQAATGEEGVKIYDLVVGDRHAKAAVKEFTGKGSGTEDLAGLLKVAFSVADAWLEEDEQIYVHPKDPYKRVDVLQSSRHVRVEINGVEVANTHKPRLLFETLLRVRTYIPLTDVRVDLLRPSDTTTQCPYKGVANYYNVELPNGEVHRDVVWYYRTAQPECGQITGFLAFYDEKVDVWVDGVKQQ
ncbi:hypothetical protein SERLA73DRAFT_191826 [Serpula lacrymans var. lacrymans S7.3]|uniref:DUF427 domain-containing protein n=2 Tax=Serpula lacrymans var. lacrymans TaxID=341189 RepID=F8QIE5_SERL3|nr:uncharacterized protein SERLADRAFT_467794 [Serpula lacrymans var. lacrymans S7.9]EGN91912.1 hypothetical protein SERLA73DRAFT_191826 [Serpula lacrymans var. lacrymans S7.3]EGO24452.1 hypothetical protein SERLADRAFT_467794 [Serpula lacrymans var. lacrymans S7.9]